MKFDDDAGYKIAVVCVCFVLSILSAFTPVDSSASATPAAFHLALTATYLALLPWVSESTTFEIITFQVILVCYNVIDSEIMWHYMYFPTNLILYSLTLLGDFTHVFNQN